MKKISTPTRMKYTKQSILFLSFLSRYFATAKIPEGLRYTTIAKLCGSAGSSVRASAVELADEGYIVTQQHAGGMQVLLTRTGALTLLSYFPLLRALDHTASRRYTLCIDTLRHTKNWTFPDEIPHCALGPHTRLCLGEAPGLLSIALSSDQVDIIVRSLLQTNGLRQARKSRVACVTRLEKLQAICRGDVWYPEECFPHMQQIKELLHTYWDAVIVSCVV